MRIRTTRMKICDKKIENTIAEYGKESTEQMLQIQRKTDKELRKMFSCHHRAPYKSSQTARGVGKQTAVLVSGKYFCNSKVELNVLLKSVHTPKRTVGQI